jgi:hypothetical protein
MTALPEAAIAAAWIAVLTDNLPFIVYPEQGRAPFTANPARRGDATLSRLTIKNLVAYKRVLDPQSCRCRHRSESWQRPSTV